MLLGEELKNSKGVGFLFIAGGGRGGGKRPLITCLNQQKQKGREFVIRGGGKKSTLP